MSPQTDLVWWVIYAASGACQPLIIEHLSLKGLAPALVLWPMLANCVGMALVLPLAVVLRIETKDPSRACSRHPVRRIVAEAIACDFGSAALLNLALLRCGAPLGLFISHQL